nr:PREDICTED: AT-rich interactive domain-containing protein 5A [Latimeria chalumnae]|eukprot:XP_014343439.1 PREDICTED: AT-rich interactive domain-containing protein 5A [Latimeria chalumnae]
MERSDISWREEQQQGEGENLKQQLNLVKYMVLKPSLETRWQRQARSTGESWLLGWGERRIEDSPVPNLKGRPRKKKPQEDDDDSITDSGPRTPHDESSNQEALSEEGCESGASDCNVEPAHEVLAAETTANCHSDCEKEEEQLFLVNLYKFMKDRNTPIERIPHLGFKQINLWKIYKAVEKLGGYDLVTARRLWKNVYDELGGSPGSTSAATCTRRHYERLVLPYVYYLKGEEDRPLLPAKPRKQYKTTKENKGKKGAESAEKNKKLKREKEKGSLGANKVLQEREKHEEKNRAGLETEALSTVVEKGNTRDLVKQSVTQTFGDCEKLSTSLHHSELGCTSTSYNLSKKSALVCQPNGRVQSSSESHKGHVSSFYSKANHGIMSPLAKKKLLAQVSEMGCLNFGDKVHHPNVEGRKAEVKRASVSDQETEGDRPSVIHQAHIVINSDSENNSEDSGTPSSHESNRGRTSCSPNESRRSSVDARSHQGPGNVASRMVAKSATPLYIGTFHSFPYINDIYRPATYYPRKDYDHKELIEVPDDMCRRFAKDKVQDRLRKRYGEANSHDQAPDFSIPRTSTSCLVQPTVSWKLNSNVPSVLHKSNSLASSGSSPVGPKACWVSPRTMSSFSKVQPKESPQSLRNRDIIRPILRTGNPSSNETGPTKRSHEELDSTYGKKLKVVSPFLKEVDSKDKYDSGASKISQQAIGNQKLTPHSAGAPPFFLSPLVPQIPDGYEGVRARFPGSFVHPMDNLKNQPISSLLPSLTINPFLFPTFNGQLITSSPQSPDLYSHMGTNISFPTSYENALRNRFYPVSSWHNQVAYSTPHFSPFHPSNKL